MKCLVTEIPFCQEYEDADLREGEYLQMDEWQDRQAATSQRASERPHALKPRVVTNTYFVSSPCLQGNFPHAQTSGKTTGGALVFAAFQRPAVSFSSLFSVLILILSSFAARRRTRLGRRCR